MHSNWKIFWHSDHLLELGDKWIKSCLLNNSNKSCPKSVHTSHIFYYIFKYLHNSQWYCLLCCRNTPDAALLVTHLKSLQWDRNSQKPPSQQIRTSNCPLVTKTWTLIHCPSKESYSQKHKKRFITECQKCECPKCMCHQLILLSVVSQGKSSPFKW